MVSPLNPLVGAQTRSQPIDLAGALAGGIMNRQAIQGNEQNLLMGRHRMDMNERQMGMAERQEQQQISRAEYEMAVQRVGVITNIAKRVREMPEGSRAAFVQNLNPDMLKSVGIDPEQAKTVPLDNASLDKMIAQYEALDPTAEDRKRKMELEARKVAVSEGKVRNDERKIEMEGNVDLVADKARAAENAKYDVEIERQPILKAAVAEAEQRINALGDKAAEADKNSIVLNMYETGMKGLDEALSGTMTGPLAGRVPAVTSDQQIAEGAVAAMAPLLKSLFRTAGEGTFTDKDQELLMAMLPTRKDTAEARASKMANINAIVRAKLGQGEPTDSGQKFTGLDKDAYDWAIDHPNDPRSAAIMQRLGVR